MNQRGARPTRKPFYKDRSDTLEEVGITQRQLNYWRAEGLFVPSLGPRSKYYTAQDIKRLLFLRRLIVELRLPIDTAKHLLVDQGTAPVEELGYLDLQHLRLMSPEDAVANLLAWAVAEEDSEIAQKCLDALVFDAFRRMAKGTRSAEVYSARRKEFYDHLLEIDRAARTWWDPEIDEWALRHRQPDDPTLGFEEYEVLDRWATRLDDPTKRLRARRRRRAASIDDGDGPD